MFIVVRLTIRPRQLRLLQRLRCIQSNRHKANGKNHPIRYNRFPWRSSNRHKLALMPIFDMERWQLRPIHDFLAVITILTKPKDSNSTWLMDRSTWWTKCKHPSLAEMDTTSKIRLWNLPLRDNWRKCYRSRLSSIGPLKPWRRNSSKSMVIASRMSYRLLIDKWKGMYRSMPC